MGKVLKSYLKTFAKAWVETLGILIFVIMLAGIVIGMISTPMQLSVKSQAYETKSNNPDIYIQGNLSKLETDFVVSYFYGSGDIKNPSTPEDYKIDDNNIIISQPKELSNGWLSNELKDYISQQLGDANTTDLDEQKGIVAQIIESAIGSFNKGNNVKSTQITDTNGDFLTSDQMFTDEVNSFFNTDSNIALYQHNILFYVIYNVMHEVKNPLYNHFELTFSDTLTVIKTNATSVTPDLTVELHNALQDKNNTSYYDKWIDNLTIVDGRNVDPNAFNNGKYEIVLTTKFAKDNNLNVGDIINVPLVSDKSGSEQDVPFTIVGLGSRYDTLTPGYYKSFMTDIKNYTYGFVDPEVISYFKNIYWQNANNINQTYYSGHEAFITKGPKYQNGDNIENVFAIDLNKSQSVFKEGAGVFTNFSSSTTIKNLSNIKIQVIVFITLGVVVLVLAFIFINFVIKKEMNETRNQLGIFKAFGYTIGELSWIFALKTFLTIFVGIFVGYLVSIPLQQFMSSMFESAVTFAYDSVYLSPIFIIVIIAGIPLIFLLVSYGLTLLYLRERTLSLIMQSSKTPKRNPHTGLISKSLAKHGRGFSLRMMVAFTSRSRGKFIMVNLLFAFSSLLFILQLSARTLLMDTVSQSFAVYSNKLDHIYGWGDFPKLDYKTVDNTQKLYVKDTTYDDRQIGAPIDYSDSDINTTLNSNDISRSRDVIHQVLSAVADAAYQTPSAYLSIDETSVGNPFEGYLTPTTLPQFLQVILTANLDVNEKGLNGIGTDNKPFEVIFDTEKNEINLNFNLTKYDSLNIITLKENISNSTHKNINGKASFYLQDIAIFVTLNIMEARVQAVAHQLYNTISNYKTNLTRDEKINSVIKAINSEKIKNKLFNFNANDPDNWRMNSELFSSKSNTISKLVDENDDSVKQKSLLSNLSKQASSLISAAMMVDENSQAIITLNKMFYDKNNETYSLMLNLLGGVDKVKDSAQLYLFDANEFGNIRNGYSLNGISDETISKLHTKNEDGSINVIISRNVAKTNNLNVNDEFTMKTDSTIKGQIKFNVIGINTDDTFAPTIIGDYSAFMTQYAANDLKKLLGLNLNSQDQQGLDIYTKPIFNMMFSNNNLYNGTLDLDDIETSVGNLRFIGDNVSITMEKDSNVFATMFNIKIDNTNIKVDSDYELINNPSLASASQSTSSSSTYVFPMTLVTVAVDDLMSTMTLAMAIFIILDAFLLLVILVVVMNIVVDESARIILTMKTLGYKNRHINWIVMGMYIISALIMFALAYILSIYIWQAVLMIVWNKLHYLLNIPWSVSAPLISFFVLFFIMFIGWSAADYQVRRRPLTQITSYS